MPMNEKTILVTKRCPCGNAMVVSIRLSDRKKYCSQKCKYLYRVRPIGLKYRVGTNRAWFVKGNKPWNTGRSVHQSVETEFKNGISVHAETQFKKGQCAGEKNVNWKGGITSEQKRIRQTVEMKLWRQSVFERDDWTCQKYGKRGGKLCAHHIRNFSDYPELRTSIENGITLSSEAHKEFHGRYGNRTNEHQMMEFLK